MAKQIAKQSIEFHQYDISVSIEVRRRSDRYNSDSLANVTLSEQVSCDSNAHVFAEAMRVVNEAQGKAGRAMNLRHEFEAGMRALEAGNDVYDPSDPSDLVGDEAEA